MDKHGRFELVKKICRGKDVLDIGCVGEERPPRWLHDHICKVAKNVIGIDSNAEGIKKLKKEGYNVRQANAEDFDLKRRFDVIVAGELIEHLDNPSLFLECARKHLRKKGTLVITTPNAYWFRTVLFSGIPPEHILLHTGKTLCSLVRRHGFRVQKFYHVCEDMPKTLKGKIFVRLYRRLLPARFSSTTLVAILRIKHSVTN